MKPNDTTSAEKSANAEVVSLYRDVLINVLMDLADINNVSKQESRRDAEEILHRVAKEGMPFLTVTLPSMGKALDRALSTEDRTLCIEGFQKSSGSVLPLLFGCYWARVFDDQGQEKPDACPLAVGTLRQLVYLLYKLEIPPSQALKDKVVQEFLETDKALPSHRDELLAKLDEGDVDQLAIARNLVTHICQGFNPYDIVPRHGPGAVATGELNHQKHRFKRLYTDLCAEYPFDGYFTSGLMHTCDEWQRWQADPPKGLQVLKSGTAKVVLVPKDSRGPRLISCEPLEYQWIQQGLGNAFRHHVERRDVCRGQINFTDQTVNRKLALAGSQAGEWVTLDMKEASDRVSLALVEELFDFCGPVLNCFKAARTTATRLPNGDMCTLKKFAPMGSNLCFPVESLVFYALAVSCIVRKLESSVSPYKGKDWRVHQRRYNRYIEKACRSVFVYGDDIIVRREDYSLLTSYFPKLGLMFNPGKCCTHGFFRESCGLDAYRGVQVQPLRMKRLWSTRRKQDAVTYASYVAFSNAAYVRGLHRTAEFITQLIEKDLGTLPVIGLGRKTLESHYLDFEPLSALVRVEYGATAASQPKNVRTRFNRSLHRFEVRCLHPTSCITQVDSDDWSMVLRRLNSPSQRRAPGIFPLAHRVTLKWAWIPLADKA
jgi:hypothetical protein